MNHSFKRVVNCLIIVMLVGSALLIPHDRALADGDMVIVNTFDDQFGTNSTQCSLREAIESINRGASFVGCTNNGYKKIYLQPGLYTLSLPVNANNDRAGGDLDIVTDMTIIGAGSGITHVSVLNPDYRQRIFHIKSPTDSDGNPTRTINVTLQGIKISNGSAMDTMGGGAVLNEKANLILSGVFLTTNQASSIGGGVVNTTKSRLIVSSSTFTYNHAINGGAIFNGGRLEVYSSLISDNYSTTITGSGGGIDNDPLLSQDYAKIANTTIAFNQSLQSNVGAGGGISNSGPLDIINSTIAYNTGEGIHLHNSSKLTIQNSIVANNSIDANCFNDGGSFVSNGYNLEYHKSGADIGECAWGAKDVRGQDPLITDKLGNYNSSMQTFGFTSKDSPAVDAIPENDASCGSATMHTNVDQRFFSRPAIGKDSGTLKNCDIGAFEEGSKFYSAYLPLILR